MTSPIPNQLRDLVIERAGNACEYCLTRDENTVFGLQVDHIIAVKHGGETTPANLALACVFCNRFKGSDIGSIALTTGELSRFFNPRVDDWSFHFRIEEFRIVPLTPTGEATTTILKMNAQERLMERQQWVMLGIKWPVS